MEHSLDIAISWKHSCFDTYNQVSSFLGGKDESDSCSNYSKYHMTNMSRRLETIPVKRDSMQKRKQSQLDVFLTRVYIYNVHIYSLQQ